MTVEDNKYFQTNVLKKKRHDILRDRNNCVIQGRQWATNFWVFCILLTQSVEIWFLRDRRNCSTSLVRFVLGVKHPVASHISSQPRLSLVLQGKNQPINALLSHVWQPIISLITGSYCSILLSSLNCEMHPLKTSL